MKPVELCERAIENSSKTNSLVLDLFGGSGSTLIACQKINRNCNMMEFDAAYCDVIIKRWQDFTGKQATHAETGKTFDESH
jgi:DNA modification methylase